MTVGCQQMHVVRCSDEAMYHITYYITNTTVVPHGYKLVAYTAPHRSFDLSSYQVKWQLVHACRIINSSSSSGQRLNQHEMILLHGFEAEFQQQHLPDDDD